MSNEVNQAYLRAYIKNRAANGLSQAPSSQLPTRQSPNQSGEMENTYRRSDMGQAQPPAPRSTRLAPEPAVAPKPTVAPKQVERQVRPDIAGVWSPIGVERGMKSTGVVRNQSAVVVNGVAPTQVPTPTASSEVTSNGATRYYRAPQQGGAVPRTEVVGQVPATRTRVPTSNRPVPQPLPGSIPTVRVDSGHAPGATSHLRAPSQRVAPPTQEPQATPAPRMREPSVKTKVPQQMPLPVAYRPAWEVDKFFWPEVLKQLELSNPETFQAIGRHIRSANQDGLNVMAVTSGERGVGRTTVAMHLARAAAAAGLNVALLDADTCYPSIIDQLRLDVEHGWQDCLFENVPMEEVAVRGIQDNLTVFPLTSVIAPQQLHANLVRVAKFIKRIATAHDLVILDSNRLNLEQRDLVGVSEECVVDATIVVVDTELSIKEKVETAISILERMGIASIGMVENFHA